MQEIQNKCIANNAHFPDYDYEDDSLEGRIALFDKGPSCSHIHTFRLRCPTTVPRPENSKSNPRSSVIHFEEGEFVTSLRQVIHPHVVGSMSLNAFAHVTGLEIGSFFYDSAPSISAKMSEYKGEPSDLTVQQILPALVGNEIGKVARIRRVSGSKESPNGLVPESRSNPRNLASVPSSK